MVRYGNIEYVLALPWERGIELISKAGKKTIEDRIWQMWLMKYGLMNKDTFVPFSKFLEASIPKEEEKPYTNLHSKEELIKLFIEMRKKANENI